MGPSLYLHYHHQTAIWKSAIQFIWIFWFLAQFDFILISQPVKIEKMGWFLNILLYYNQRSYNINKHYYCILNSQCSKIFNFPQKDPVPKGSNFLLPDTYYTSVNVSQLASHIAWPSTILQNDNITISWDFFSGWQHQQPCRDTLVLSSWNNLMIS